MLTNLFWKKLSQATATTVLGAAIVVACGTNEASAVNIKMFKISGTLGDKNYGYDTSFDNDFNVENGSFDGTYTVDVDQLPTTNLLSLENFDITIRDSSGASKDRFFSSYDGFPVINPFGDNYYAYLEQSKLNFVYAGPSPSTVRELLLYVTSDFTGIGTGGLYGVMEDGVPINGFYSRRSPPIEFLVTSFKSEAVPEPLTVGGTAVAGAMGLWLKRKQHKDS